MRTLGLIGGITWHSTVDYYRGINEQVAARLGGGSSAKLVLQSLNFAEIRPPSDPGGWPRVIRVFTDAARRLEGAGAEALVFCANTPHVFAPEVQAKIGIPILHIAEATAAAVVARGYKRVALLGTRPTMEGTFYPERLSRGGVETLIPEEADRAFMHASILDEMGMGAFKAETRARYLEVIASLVGRGAEAVVLGCTEIPILLRGADCPVPTFDTTALHVGAAVAFALGDGG
jgi:aspartate racemase